MALTPGIRQDIFINEHSRSIFGARAILRHLSFWTATFSRTNCVNPHPMAQPIPTPSSAAVGRATSVLAMAQPPPYDNAFMFDVGIDATKLFGRHYNTHGGNIVSLTPQIIWDDSPTVDNLLKQSLPSARIAAMPSSPRKHPSVASNQSTLQRDALAGLVALGAVVDPNADGANSLTGQLVLARHPGSQNSSF